MQVNDNLGERRYIIMKNKIKALTENINSDIARLKELREMFPDIWQSKSGEQLLAQTDHMYRELIRTVGELENMEKE